LKNTELNSLQDGYFSFVVSSEFNVSAIVQSQNVAIISNKSFRRLKNIIDWVYFITVQGI